MTDSLFPDAAQFTLVDDPEWVGPREDWYCGGESDVVRSIPRG